MNVNTDLDIWILIVGASPVVKAVMLLLVIVSFMSWMYIFSKWFAIRRARSQTERFEREFWGGNDLNLLYQGAVNNRHTTDSPSAGTPVALCTSSAARSMPSRFRASSTTRTPSWASPRAIDLPIPLLAPVTTATRPLSPRFTSHPLSLSPLDRLPRRLP
jgi:hypothetical protein